MGASRSYLDELLKDLKDPLETCAYLNAAIAEGDKDHFLIALRNVAEAHGGLLRLSRRTRMNRGHLSDAPTRRELGDRKREHTLGRLGSASRSRLEIPHPLIAP